MDSVDFTLFFFLSLIFTLNAKIPKLYNTENKEGNVDK